MDTWYTVKLYGLNSESLVEAEMGEQLELMAPHLGYKQLSTYGQYIVSYIPLSTSSPSVLF